MGTPKTSVPTKPNTTDKKILGWKRKALEKAQSGQPLSDHYRRVYEELQRDMVRYNNASNTWNEFINRGDWMLLIGSEVFDAKEDEIKEFWNELDRYK